MNIQFDYLKSRVISEDDKCHATRIIQQLDSVEHIAKNGFWVSTDELGFLLNLEQSFVFGLNLEVESEHRNYSFWLNRSNYARLISKCQQIRDRNLKLSKFLKPYPDRLISFSLLLIPSTTPLVVRFSK